jgi:hypothetical protein
MPSMAIANAKPPLRSAGSIAAMRSSSATTRTPNPARTMVRGENRMARTEPDSDVTNIAIGTGSIRRPVSNAFRPTTSWR